MGAKKMHLWNVYIMKPVGFVPRMFQFIQPACYASIENKTNFRNDSEQNIHRFYFWLPKQYDLYQK